MPPELPSYGGQPLGAAVAPYLHLLSHTEIARGQLFGCLQGHSRLKEATEDLGISRHGRSEPMLKRSKSLSLQALSESVLQKAQVQTKGSSAAAQRAFKTIENHENHTLWTSEKAPKGSQRPFFSCEAHGSGHRAHAFALHPLRGTLLGIRRAFPVACEVCAREDEDHDVQQHPVLTS